SGATVFRIYVGGDTSKTYNARVLGYSECSDLAVIDIEGEGFPYLRWHEGPVKVGMDIYVAGFPLGDPNFTLTKGIISKEKADGRTAFASVESVLEYDATTNPGNSGGPVVTSNGEVVAVHYAGNREARQAFGIAADLARGIVEILRKGENVDSIGVNGAAVANQDKTIVGVWAYSVQPGSAADKAGLKPGDIITRLGNVPVATDGTLYDYCDIIRSHSATDVLPIEVLRYSTGEILSGQLNGRALEVVSVFGAPSDTATTPDTGTPSGAGVPGTTVNPNASQPGEYYYTTEFEDMSDWEYILIKGSESGFTQEARNGRFRVEILEPNTWVYFINTNFIYQDVQLDILVENLGKNTNYTGLFCRYSEDGWYEANILNTGEYVLFASDGSRLEQLYRGGSRLIRTGKETNTYTLVCKGDELTLGINGVEVRKVSTKAAPSVPPLREGQVGFFVASENIYPLIVEFDWFTASVVY
ncbi:MAG: S1C family serine protease, partial [Anaerolineales bacterium]|nr:S1C family serine protease [Anaerolineales bacterium]MDW8448333.1 S1C family serine protease [Anaerolineales bacterium]